MRSGVERAPLLLGLAFLALALVGLGATDVTGDDEAREVAIVQDVLAGHWLWPRFNDDLIPDKPILTHWLGAASCAVAGFSETAVRLPSAIAGAALVAWTARFGMETLGPGPGIAAALLLATFPAFGERVRVARPDVVMLLLLAMAYGLAWRVHRERRPRDATAMLALVGLATFAKGPVAPALFATTLLLFLAWQRELRRVRDFVTLPGALAFVVLGGGWYAVALAGWGDEFVRQHLIGRYLRNLAGGVVEGHAYSPKSLVFHLTFYPIHLLAIALPWTPLVAVTLAQLGRRGLATPLVRFLLCWAVAPVLVFTPAEWKLRYYLLPSLPALALLAGPLAAELVGRRIGPPRPTPVSIGVALAALATGGAAAWLALQRPELLSRSDQATVAGLLRVLPGGTGTAALLAGALLGIGAAAVALRLWGPLLAVTGALMAGWLAIGGPAAAAADPAVASLRRFAETAAARFPEPGRLVFYGPAVRSVVVYVGHPVPSLDRDASRIGKGLGVIATRPVWERLAAAGRVGQPLATGEGQIGNLERGTLVLAAGRGDPP